MRRVEDAVLIESYARHGNVWRVADEVGLCGQTVHERLKKLGAAKPIRVFTDADCDVLRVEYHAHADNGKLDLLALRLGRTKQFICRQARKLGLTDQKRPSKSIAVFKYMDEQQAQRLFDDFAAARMPMRVWCKRKGVGQVFFSQTMRKFFPAEWEALIELKQPKQSMYRYGRAFEYQVRDDLKKRGYFALRSPGSRTPIDILAIAPGIVLFVQCKRNSSLPPSEWNELHDLAASVGAVAVLASKPDVRGIVYERITGRKTGTRTVRQPKEPYSIPALNLTAQEVNR